MLERQHYRIVGQHGAVKLCHWLKKKLTEGKPCYKELFYGIQSHRCLQMTPTVDACTQSCLFCWRFQGFTKTAIEDPDDPVRLLDDSIIAQRKLLSGYGGDPRVDREMYEEALQPNQVAISLAGEPTLYPLLGEFIEEARKRGMTTFLVTNGTMPEVLENLDPLPTQLYVTVAAPNEEIYRKLLIPRIERGWERLRKTLEILPSLDTRTIIRHTLVEGWNIGWEKEYAALDRLGDPDFVEPKAYVYVGYSRTRMTWDNMPSHDRVQEFSAKLAEEMGLEVLREHRPSRVVLLGDREKEKMIKISGI